MRPVNRSTVVSLLLCASCGPLASYKNLQLAVSGSTKPLDPTTKAEAVTCLDAAQNESGKAETNRVMDMALIVFGSIFVGGGAATTTASTFISDTHNGGQPIDTRQWVAGAGAVMVGIGAALFAIRTGLSLGEISSAETTAAATQAATAMQIVDSDGDAGARDTLYAQCAQQTAKITTAYPASSVNPVIPTPSATPPPASSTAPAPTGSGSAATSTPTRVPAAPR
jgi:hypothetical protein